MAYNYQLCYVDIAQVRSFAMLTALTDRLVADGWRLCLSDGNLWPQTRDHEPHLWHAHYYNQQDPEYQALPDARKRELEQPGKTAFLLQDIDAFCQNNIPTLTIDALGAASKNSGLQFYMSFNLLNDGKTLDDVTAGMLQHIEDRNSFGGEYWFDRLPTVLYEALHPNFMYDCTEYDTPFYSADLHKGNLPYLYVHNYIGPALVARLGYQHIKDTPQAQVKDLSDGGLYLYAEGDIHIIGKHLGLTPQHDVK